jgi:hypothetical protein
MYVRRRFVKDFAGVNCLGTTIPYLSNDTSLENIRKDVCMMSMWLSDLARSENDCFD